MSTTSTLKLFLTGARKAYDSYADFRDRKVSDAYDALSSAAESYGPKADSAVESAREVYDDSIKKAGEVTKAARIRFEKAVAAAEQKGDAVAKDVKSSTKKVSRKARRQAAKAERKLNRKEDNSHWVRNITIAALTASGLAAVIYAVANRRKNVPGTTPPRVEDQVSSDDEPVLVYSTETGAPAETVPADVEVPAEKPEKNDEELTEAEAVQAEFDAKNAPQRDQSDK